MRTSNDRRQLTDEIEKWRLLIDQVDTQIAELLKKRTEYAIEIGRVKARASIAVYDPAREQEVIENVARQAEGFLDEGAMKRLFERIIDETRRAERLHRSLLEKLEEEGSRG